MNTNAGFPFHERVSSNKTEALFIALTGLFLLLGVWRATAAGPDTLAAVFFVLSGIFLFYSVNFRTLNIQLTPDELKLTFGLFRWTVAMENIEACRLDEIPMLLRLGGAGIHFMLVHKRYRASFNFLEYPRIVIALKKKAGPVQDISFTTRRPDDILRLMRGEISALPSPTRGEGESPDIDARRGRLRLSTQQDHSARVFTHPSRWLSTED